MTEKTPLVDPTIEDRYTKGAGGKIINYSASSAEGFNLCQRRWWFIRIQGVEDPKSDALTFGTAAHAVCEEYLRSGTLLTKGTEIEERGEIIRIGQDHIDRAKTAFKHLPKPGAANVELWIPRLPVFDGMIDGIHRRMDLTGKVDYWAVNFPEAVRIIGDEDGLHVGDHKSTKDVKWTKSPDELRHNPQGQLYCYSLIAGGLAPEWCKELPIHFYHNYIYKLGKPRAELVHAVMPWHLLTAAWDAAGETAASMIRIATLDKQEDVPYNLRGCEAFGRPCPALSICKARTNKNTAIEAASAFDRRPTGSTITRSQTEDFMGGMQDRWSKRNTGSAPAAGSTTMASTTASEPVGDTRTFEDRVSQVVAHLLPTFDSGEVINHGAVVQALVTSGAFAKVDIKAVAEVRKAFQAMDGFVDMGSVGYKRRLPDPKKENPNPVVAPDGAPHSSIVVSPQFVRDVSNAILTACTMAASESGTTVFSWESLVKIAKEEGLADAWIPNAIMLSACEVESCPDEVDPVFVGYMEDKVTEDQLLTIPALDILSVIDAEAGDDEDPEEHAAALARLPHSSFASTIKSVAINTLLRVRRLVADDPKRLKIVLDLIEAGEISTPFDDEEDQDERKVLRELYLRKMGGEEITAEVAKEVLKTVYAKVHASRVTKTLDKINSADEVASEDVAEETDSNDALIEALTSATTMQDLLSALRTFATPELADSVSAITDEYAASLGTGTKVVEKIIRVNVPGSEAGMVIYLGCVPEKVVWEHLIDQPLVQQAIEATQRYVDNSKKCADAGGELHWSLYSDFGDTGPKRVATEVGKILTREPLPVGHFYLDAKSAIFSTNIAEVFRSAGAQIVRSVGF